MRAMPSFTSSTVPTSRTSIDARSAAWISLRRMSFSSPGLRLESVAIGLGSGDCENYPILGPPAPPPVLDARAGAPLQKRRQRPPRPQASELLGRDARHPSGGPRQMAGGGIRQDPRDGADAIRRVAEQIRRAGGAHQIDDALQVRRAAGRELP